MKKRLLMILTLAFLLVGCGNQQETNTPSTDQPTTTESTTTNEPTSTLTEETTTTEEPTEPPHEHAYTEAITTEATCEADGVKTFTCDCGDSYTEVITATGHNYGEYISNNDATYTADGTETATCVCGLTDTRTASGSKLEYTYTDLSKTMYAKSSVNVRNLPSTDGEKLGGLTKAQEVSVTGQCNETGWYRIDYNGGTGYVSSDYLVNDKPVEETPAPSQPTEPAECPYPLYQPVDNGNSISWYYLNGQSDQPYTWFDAFNTLSSRYGVFTLSEKTDWTGYFYNGYEVAHLTMWVP